MKRWGNYEETGSFITSEFESLVLTPPKKTGIPFEVAVTTPDRPRLKKNTHTLSSTRIKKKMLPTVHERTQDDGSYKYSAARAPSDSFMILYFSVVEGAVAGIRTRLVRDQ